MTSSTRPPRVLIVTTHPDTGSLTHHIADSLHAALDGVFVETAHLAQEDFDPRFDLDDRATYTGDRSAPDEVRAEQRRLDQVTDVVLVFPVYWWSMPALLKGWIDRVFIAGWAFDIDGDGRIAGALGRIRMHMIPISATAENSFRKHGYVQSFTTQVEQGVIAYCGMRQGVTAFVWESESPEIGSLPDRVGSAVSAVASAVCGGGASG